MTQILELHDRCSGTFAGPPRQPNLKPRDRGGGTLCRIASTADLEPRDRIGEILNRTGPATATETASARQPQSDPGGSIFSV